MWLAMNDTVWLGVQLQIYTWLGSIGFGIYTLGSNTGQENGALNIPADQIWSEMSNVQAETWSFVNWNMTKDKWY